MDIKDAISSISINSEDDSLVGTEEVDGSPTSNGNVLNGNLEEVPDVAAVCSPEYRVQNLVHNITSPVNSGLPEPLKVRVKTATDRKDKLQGLIPAYSMGSKPKGLALLINNINFMGHVYETRVGAEVDHSNFIDLLKGLGYEVEEYKDKTANDMKNIIKLFSMRKEHKNVDSCIVAIFSHGNNMGNGCVSFGTDGLPVRHEWIFEKFSNESCHDLMKKPKIFFLQSCRGDGKNFGVKQTSNIINRTSTDGSQNSQYIRSCSDMLIANSTLPGFESHRDKFLGTWYINAVCEVFMVYACDMDIEDMLKMVDMKLSTLISEENTLQTSTYENRGFNCKLYFNPGLYDEVVNTNRLGDDIEGEFFTA